MRATALALTVLAALAATPLFAAVTVENLTKAKFSGGASVVNIFAGKAAKEGVIVKTAIDGDRRATQTNREVEVIDLAAEKIWTYKFSRRGKPGRCKVTSFDERREAMAALDDIDFSGGRESAESPDASQLPEYEVTVTMNETDTQETHGGLTGNLYDIQVSVHRPQMALEEGGGARIDTALVIGPKPAGWDESVDWNRRYIEAMDIDFERFAGLAKLLASAPALKKAMEGLNEKESAFDGAVLRSEMRLFTMADPRPGQQAQSGDSEDTPTTLGGLGAKIGGSLLKRNKDDAAAAGPKEAFVSSTVLTSYTAEGDDLLTLPERCEQ